MQTICYLFNNNNNYPWADIIETILSFYLLYLSNDL